MFVIGEVIRITVTSGSEEDPTYVFPPYTDPKMRAAIKKLGATRLEYRKNKPIDRGFDRRLAFFDEMCSGVENFGVFQGEDNKGNRLVVPLREAHPDDWQVMVPTNHKTSCAAHFEEQGTVTEDERGN